MKKYLLLLFLATFFFSCGDEDISFESAKDAENSWVTSTAYNGNDNNTTEPEEKKSDLLLSPTELSGKYALILDEQQNFLNLIDFSTRKIKTIIFDFTPKQLLAIPKKRWAALLDSATGFLLLLDTETEKTIKIKIRKNLNKMVLSSDNSYIFLYNDQKNSVALSGIPFSYNEVSLVNLKNKKIEEAKATSFTVSAAIKMVVFSADSSIVSAVTEDGIDLISSLNTEKRKTLYFDPANSLTKVKLSSDLKTGAAMSDLDKKVHFINLAKMKIEEVSVEGTPTDLILDDEKKVVYISGENSLSTMNLLDKKVSLVMMDESLGAILINNKNSQLLLHQIPGSENLIKIQKTTDNSFKSITIPRKIKDISLSPDGKKLLLVHENPGSFLEASAHKKEFNTNFLVSIVNLDNHKLVPLILPKEVSSYIFTENSSYLFIMCKDYDQVIYMDLKSFLSENIKLASKAYKIATLPENKGIVISQLHEQGRVSFFDPALKDGLKTVTGYRINEDPEN